MHPGSGSHLREQAVHAMSGDPIEELRVLIQQIVNGQLTEAAEAGTLDVVKDLGEPLTMAVAGRLMGIPDEDRRHFHHLTRELMPHIFNLIGGAVGAEGTAAVQDFREYILALAEQKRARPGNDLISAIVESEALGESISEDDYLAFEAIFVFASSENMLNSIGNMVLALAQHPEQWLMLQREPRLLSSAMEELLRFDSPVQFVALVARETLEIDGRRIAAGETVLAGIGSANRDPEEFANPDCLDFHRRAIPHLNFGAGGLYCIGASVARAEGLCVLEALTQRFHPAEITTSSLNWRTNPFVLRGLVSLPLSLKPLPQAQAVGAAFLSEGPG